MVNGLSVAADQVSSDLESLLGSAHGLGVKLSQQKVQARKIGNARLCGVHRLQDLLAHSPRISALKMAEQLEAQIESASRDSHQRYVNTVRGSAAHYSGDDHAGTSGKCREGSSGTAKFEKVSSISFSFSTTPGLGSAANPRSSRDRFLKFKMRRAASPTSAANLRSRSASRSTASKLRHTSS